MKKLLLSVFILICLGLIGLYVFIPGSIKISKLIFLKSNLAVTNRFLMDENNWSKWLSRDSGNSVQVNPVNRNLSFKNYDYHIGNAIMNTVQVSISNNQKSTASLMRLIPIKEDTVAVEWKVEINSSLNPINRIKSYGEAKQLEKDMGDILKNLQHFLEKKGNAYGLNITQQQVVDTILISTKYISKTFPSTEEIYSLINNLHTYILKEGAEETNPPMLNIANESNTYRTMVAIPINKIISERNNYVFKRMVPGKILVAEVRGGDYTARQALKQLDLYINDNHLSSPAIPFESLITNRPLEQDTTKWITKIYYPIY